MGGLSSFEAWKQAVQKKRGGRPEALIAVLARSAGWSASSSTVERGFAHAKALKGDGKSQDNNLEDEQDCLVIAQDVRPGLSDPAEKSLLQSAAAVWRSSCGRTRSSGESRQKRWDAGIARPHRTKKESESGFLQARSAIVDQAASSEAGPIARLPKTVTSADSIIASLTPKLLQEIDFNEEKEAKAKVEAYLQGHLLPAEITQDLVDKSTVFLQKIAKAQRERNNQNRNVKAKVLKDQAPWDPNVQVFSTVPGYRVPYHCREVTIMRQAELIVVQDPASAAGNARFVAGLLGARLCTPDYVNSRGERGSCLAFRRATSIYRKVFITDAFMGENLDIAQDLSHALSMDNCRWQLQPNMPVGRANQQTLVLRGSAEACPGVKLALNISEVLQQSLRRDDVCCPRVLLPEQHKGVGLSPDGNLHGAAWRLPQHEVPAFR
ncbi:unnamed protein product [Symbiodinium sp. CCMP2456]|nr:unnamed protein product [Symbiodinium sp. CCMP2456]